MLDQGERTQMDVFRDRDVQIGAAVGLIVGLLLGWFVLGWWLAPVQWVDARPADLHPLWQQNYVAMVVDSYILSGDSQIARARLEGFDPASLATLFGEVEQAFERQGAGRQARSTRALADLLGVSIVRLTPTTAVASALTEVEPVTPPAGEGEGMLARIPLWAQVCGIVLLAIVIVVGVVYGAIVYQRRSMKFEGEEDEVEAGIARPRWEQRIESMNVGDRVTIHYQGEGPGYEQTVQIYRGDEIIGSCGLRGVTTLSDGERVVACAAWLYEPQAPGRAADTRVLAGRRVYQNEALRASLVHDREPGEVILAAPGQMARLEHATLEMTLQVIDVEYTDLDEQYISRLVVELEPVTKRRESDVSIPFDLT